MQRSFQLQENSLGESLGNFSNFLNLADILFRVSVIFDYFFKHFSSGFETILDISLLPVLKRFIAAKLLLILK